MPKGMLGDNRLLDQVFGGPVKDLLQGLNGPDGEILLAELKRFCRREPCWGDILVPDREPGIPYMNWRVKRHTPHGVLKLTYNTPFQSSRRIFLSDRLVMLLIPGSGDVSIGEMLSKVRDFEMLNANVLDLFHKRREIIPESWKIDESGIPRRIHFPGTVFRQEPGNHSQIRHLRFLSEAWGCDQCSLSQKWADGDCIAVLKKN